MAAARSTKRRGDLHGASWHGSHRLASFAPGTVCRRVADVPQRRWARDPWFLMLSDRSPFDAADRARASCRWLPRAASTSTHAPRRPRASSPSPTRSQARPRARCKFEHLTALNKSCPSIHVHLTV
uniref:Uncharacterized protein n=1 Tax=Oryza punctata TaxID=4537 RepID=A0A0E0JJY9_ORYPU